MTNPPERVWTARCEYNKKQVPFDLGNVVAETELEAERRLKELWISIVPCDPPETMVCLPGPIVLSDEAVEERRKRGIPMGTIPTPTILA